MSRRSKRQVAPRPSPPPPPSSSSPPAAGSTTASGCFDPAWSAFLQGGTTMAPPVGGQQGWWSGAMPQNNSFGPASSDGGMDMHPPGGFLSMLQTGHPPHVSFPATWPPMPPMAPTTDSGTKHAARSRSKTKSVINLDDGDDVRTTKRLTWDKDDDECLVSAWLYPTNDPINGNGKKNESYWGDVVELYNNTTPMNRKREVKHLKDRWQRIKRWFCTVGRFFVMNPSGMLFWRILKSQTSGAWMMVVTCYQKKISEKRSVQWTDEHGH